MLYNSFEFLFAFLPVCLLVYFLTAKLSRWLANALLAAMSFVFYAWWNTHNLYIIAASILVNYTLGAMLRMRLRRAEEIELVYETILDAVGVAGRNPFATRRDQSSQPINDGADRSPPRDPVSYAILTVGVVINLAALAYFKYADFGLANFAALTGHPFVPLKITLPLGISFFTFTQIAFLVDAYRGKAKELGFFRYCLFVAFFPHLIAGPIVHHSELMPQFAEPRAKRWWPSNFDIGIAFLTLGLFKKVIIADSCGPWADEVFGADKLLAAGNLICRDAWRGALAYTMQLYFDFSGYCDMAIGLAMMFNIRLPDNFDSPYKSVDIIDFWRRWHMTLSRFLRDYLYFPLGGNRKGEPRRQFNLMATMLLGGIWHGAGWTYLIWGGYHGLLLVINHAWASRKIPLPGIVARGITLGLVIIGWVIFRAKSMHDATSVVRAMFTPGRGVTSLVASNIAYIQFGVLAFLLLLVNFAPNTKQWIERRPLNRKRAILLGFLFFVCLLRMREAYLTHEPQPFIYFQF
ncbi:MAG TPA: MBOAT family protein [Humisphaera sp.]|nr:MBOAT family protein [Humisphaera sp.]